jgi:hypothetical protein
VAVTDVPEKMLLWGGSLEQMTIIFLWFMSPVCVRVCLYISFRATLYIIHIS